SRFIELGAFYGFDYIRFPDRDQDVDIHLGRLRAQWTLNTNLAATASSITRWTMPSSRTCGFDSIHARGTTCILSTTRASTWTGTGSRRCCPSATAAFSCLSTRIRFGSERRRLRAIPGPETAHARNHRSHPAHDANHPHSLRIGTPSRVLCGPRHVASPRDDPRHDLQHPPRRGF